MSYFKRGGLHFVRLGPVGLTFYRTKRKETAMMFPAWHEERDVPEASAREFLIMCVVTFVFSFIWGAFL